MACAAFSCCAAGCPLAAGAVLGLGEDGGEQAGEGIAGAGGPVSAVPAAGVAGHVAADEAEDGGEGDAVWVRAGLGCGAGGGGGGHVVDEQQRPGVLAGQFRGLAAQGAAGDGDGFLQVEEGDLSRPLLIPMKKKSSLA